MKRWAPCLGLSALLVAADQGIKLWVLTQKDAWLSHGGGPEILGLLNLTYTTNTGAAGGILSNALWFLIPLSLIASAAIVWAIVTDYFGAWPARWALALILAGALGNAVDRIRLREVIDYLQFSFWRTFPVFNFADSCVVVGGGLFMLYIVVSGLSKDRTAAAEEAEPHAVDTDDPG